MAKRKHHRPRSSAFLVFGNCTTLGWSVTRRISFEEGERRVLTGLWRRVNDDSGQHVGYQPLLLQLPPLVVGDASPAALREAETRANAGLMGRSRTARMSDRERRERVHPKSGRILPEMDFVEHAQELVKCYPGSANYADMQRGISDRAVRVYPKGKK